MADTDTRIGMLSVLPTIQTKLHLYISRNNRFRSKLHIISQISSIVCLLFVLHFLFMEFFLLIFFKCLTTILPITMIVAK